MGYITLNPQKKHKLCTFCLLGRFHKNMFFCRAFFLPRLGNVCQTNHSLDVRASQMVGFQNFKESTTVFWPLWSRKWYNSTVSQKHVKAEIPTCAFLTAFAPFWRLLRLFDGVLRLFCDTVCSPKMQVITITQRFLPRRVDIYSLQNGSLNLIDTCW